MTLKKAIILSGFRQIVGRMDLLTTLSFWVRMPIKTDYESILDELKGFISDALDDALEEHYTLLNIYYEKVFNLVRRPPVYLLYDFLRVRLYGSNRLCGGKTIGYTKSLPTVVRKGGFGRVCQL